MVDVFELKGGRVVGLNDECLALYVNMEAFHNSDKGDAILASYWRPKGLDVIKNPRLGTYTDTLTEEYTLDLFTLDTGDVLGIDSETVCLYPNREEVFSSNPRILISMPLSAGDRPEAGQPVAPG